MATYTDTLGFNKGSAALPADALFKMHRVEVVLDFPKIIAARLAAGATALAATDILEVIPIPAGTLVTNVGMEIVTVGASGSISIGDGSDDDGYLAATVSTSAGYFGGVPGVATTVFSPALSGGKIYAAADTIDIKITTAVPSAAVVRVFALMADVT